MKQYVNELFKRKDLLIYLVISGLKAQYRNTFLGFFWWLLDPLLGVMVYYFLVVVVLGRGDDIPNYGAFLVIGLIVWRWVRSVVNSSSKSIASNASIITRVYLPKAIFPLSVCFTQLINFSIGLVIAAVVLACFRIVPGVQLLWLPVLVLMQIIFLAALSLVVGYVCVFIRDIDNFIHHFMRVWFYASPVIWSSGRLPKKYSWIVDINPVTAYLNSYRNIFLYNQSPEFMKLLPVVAVSLIVIAAMVYYYSRHEHKIIKVL
jgi:lipopolysaccharide transport system permease protein/teichoic acid transport system permease protein